MKSKETVEWNFVRTSPCLSFLSVLLLTQSALIFSTLLKWGLKICWSSSFLGFFEDSVQHCKTFTSSFLWLELHIHITILPEAIVNESQEGMTLDSWWDTAVSQLYKLGETVLVLMKPSTRHLMQKTFIFQNKTKVLAFKQN